jgi:hypothetical protein
VIGHFSQPAFSLAQATAQPTNDCSTQGDQLFQIKPRRIRHGSAFLEMEKKGNRGGEKERKWNGFVGLSKIG